MMNGITSFCEDAIMKKSKRKREEKVLTPNVELPADKSCAGGEAGGVSSPAAGMSNMSSPTRHLLLLLSSEL